MIPGVLAYLALGLAYWLSSLRAFGLPPEVERLPPDRARRVRFNACLLTVLLWPVALIYDIVSRLMR
jgi:hypothetical protein